MMNDDLDSSGSSKPTHVVAVFSMRPKWLKRNPDAARLRIRVLSKAKFSCIADGEPINDHLPKRFRRWVEEERSEEYRSELDAWEGAIALHERMLAARRNVDLLFGSSNCRLYVFQMIESVIEESAFASMNPSLPTDKEKTCVYVGMTSKTPDVRYTEHRSANHDTSTKWGRKYFASPFDESFRDDLVRAFESEGHRVAQLTRYEALKGELALRCWLQERGIAAYSN